MDPEDLHQPPRSEAFHPDSSTAACLSHPPNLFAHLSV